MSRRDSRDLPPPDKDRSRRSTRTSALSTSRGRAKTTIGVAPSAVSPRASTAERARYTLDHPGGEGRTVDGSVDEEPVRGQERRRRPSWTKADAGVADSQPREMASSRLPPLPQDQDESSADGTTAAAGRFLSQEVRRMEESALSPSPLPGGRKTELLAPVQTGPELPEIDLAVIGASGVGKSTFIQRALGLRNLPAVPLSARTMSINGVLFHVRLLELEFHHLDLDVDRSVRWPIRTAEMGLPRIQGALVLCDLMSERSLSTIPRILSSIVAADLPFIFVSCNSDPSSEMCDLQPKLLERAGLRPDRVECAQTSARRVGSERRCIGSIIRKVRLERVEPPPALLAGRNRAMAAAAESSSSPPPPPPPSSSSSSSSSRRDQVDLTASALRGPTLARTRSGSGLSSANADARPGRRIQYEGSPTAGVEEDRRCSSTNSAGSAPRRSPSTAGSSVSAGSHARSRVGSASGLHVASKLVVVSDAPFTASRLTTPPSTTDARIAMEMVFTEPDYRSSGGLAAAPETATPGRHDDERSGGPPPRTGETLEDLVDRLLAPAVSKSDAVFPVIFFCLYRKFAAPRDVLEIWLRRFHDLDDGEAPPTSGTSVPLRYLAVLSQWMTAYPGDFSHPRTRHLANELISNLPSTTRPYANLVKEMQTALDADAEDDDGLWAKSDGEWEAGPSSNPASPTESLPQRSRPRTEAAPEDLEAPMRDVTVHDEPGRRSARVSGAPSNTSSQASSAMLSGGSSQTFWNTVEVAEREAQRLVPVPRMRLSKIQWRLFMSIREEDVAEELTRIDWIMFSAIRLRDLIRHVSLSSDQREKCKSVENVSRMISQFNHLAYWVTNMILLRDKPKHRAKALEKFMSVAWKLRYLNNYNALGAVVAGINGNPVYRLIQTRELISPKAQKDFMSLEILMGTQKGHSAYRMAWGNTSSPRIPFLPLHRRDLISGEEGNRTFLDHQHQRINWKKFEVMGEVVVTIVRSQGTPYPELERRMDVQRLVLDVDLVKDDDILYDRSVELESPGAGASDTSMRRKFSWFQR